MPETCTKCQEYEQKVKEAQLELTKCHAIVCLLEDFIKDKRTELEKLGGIS